MMKVPSFEYIWAIEYSGPKNFETKYSNSYGTFKFELSEMFMDDYILKITCIPSEGKVLAPIVPKCSIVKNGEKCFTFGL